MTAADGVADRLNWLFDVVAVADPPGWRPWTNAEVGAVLGAGGPLAVERLRAGEPASQEQLTALAAFFGVRPQFFGEDPAEVDAARDRLLELVLRDCGVRAYLICRTPLLSATRRGEQLRKALRTVRSASLGSGDAAPSRDCGPSMTPSMSQAQLRAWCHDLVHELGLHPPFDAHELCLRLGERRGRRIEVRPTDLGATTGVGHLVPKRRADYILVERTAPASQQELVIYHEIIHLARGHLDAGESLTCGLAAPAADTGQADHGAYADRREWEAEVGARTLSRMSRERTRPNLLPVAAGPAEQSIAAAFGFVARDRSS
ncbi:ImmA/IrrE family metallo-endopeptidase [Kutzneria albida]|uniref:Uncharacterized protein n=1 Tax=Kutzneria albida DSM 43870 TaxID=1449976 RepID=W5W4X5_9PSEU|nr:ImmA/IrrE family metallo-endopeptidase [Kutzneria albida]AHH95947.1 hypothetical protein KALB_2579 [Kutzneria albida DSM 43870]